MRNLPVVDAWIGDALSGSELSMVRRAEIADEWREHVHERIAAETGAGVSHEDAVRTALAAFGDPARLRRQLRRGQRAHDLRDALAKTRLLAAWTIAGAGVMVFLVGPAPAVHRLAGGCVFFVAVVLAALVPAFVANLVELRVTRLRPRDEFHLVPSFLRWTIVVSAFLGGVLLLAPAVVITVYERSRCVDMTAEASDR